MCNEQGLDREMVIEAMKDAVKAAARKQFKAHDKTGESIEVDWNNEEGLIEISVNKTVVEVVENPSSELSLVEAQELAGDEIELGDMLLIPLPTEEMGRIAAQTAKQILVQKVREAIREKIYDEYIDKKGELINGTIKRFERGDIIVDLGNNLEAILPRKEQSRGEVWNQGERIRVAITDVSKEQKGQQIVVSRASSELIKRLFEMEVPEIYDETVVIKSAVREPGDRAKIAVTSNEKDVDPVGACVGMKGSRVQSIIKELRGEKIDIIEWSDEPSVFAANALSPAKVSQVRITDIENRKMAVIVGEDQLSLAIGKKGQNVRLATRLVGWDIDIVSEEVLKKEIAQQMGQMMASGVAVPLTSLESVSPVHAEVLSAKGIADVERLAQATVDEICEILDVSVDEAEQIIASAKAVVDAKDGGDAPAEEETPAETEAAEPAAEVADDAASEGETPADEVSAGDAAADEISEEAADDDDDASASDVTEDAMEGDGDDAPEMDPEVPSQPGDLDDRIASGSATEQLDVSGESSPESPDAVIEVPQAATAVPDDGLSEDSDGDEADVEK
ncbi:MAG: transcription termination factor NusA [Blastocatellia bacterium]|nr:transcription termination factor NusA [Blastocatellia bacterium]